MNKAGTWYLVAAGQAAAEQQAGQHGGDPAVFRVGRVTAARLLPAVGVTRPDGFDLAAFWERWSAAFVTSRSQVLVRVRATASALAIFPYVFGDAGRRAAAAAGPADAEGLREVTLSFEEEAVAAHRLAGFGGDLRVIEPQAVRDGLIRAPGTCWPATPTNALRDVARRRPVHAKCGLQWRMVAVVTDGL